MVAKEILDNLENDVNKQLERCERYTLTSLNLSEVSALEKESAARFFNLISLLKDISILGRKLLELAPQLNSLKIKSRPSSPEPTRLNELKGSSYRMKLNDDDATSEDLLASLIESSSSDDFLILSSSLESISTKDMILAALIYIKAHDCFTLSHDIQGVVMVLRRVKFMILNILAPKDQMELITKLLTSIGRYNEMNYVFDLFRDRNQFEMLLSKGVERTPELRIALFHYVKKNPEFFTLVTLNFSMFREIAESLEASALSRIDTVIERASTSPKSKFYRTREKGSSDNLTNSTTNSTSSDQHSIRKCIGSTNKIVQASRYSGDILNLALVELIDASDCFNKAGCFKRSELCERRAKLTALQLALLPAGIDVISWRKSVSSEQLAELIPSFDSFEHADIVAEAYDYHLAWRQALFKNVILLADQQYLNKYCSKYDLTSALAQELVVLYRQNQTKLIDPDESNRMAQGMRLLLEKVEDVEIRCRLSTLLNFNDVKEQLIRQDIAIAAHLKDLKLI